MPQAYVVATAMAVTAGAVAYSAIKSHKETKAASKAAKEEAEKQRKWQEEMAQKELEAGEYFEQLNMKQMELQAQSANISTLANLIAEQKKTASLPQQVFTLPAAKTSTPMERINQAIHEIFKGS
jgi:hypothetical protein